MLSRYNSEFQWYRERVGPVQRHLGDEYPTRNMATDSAVLNAEPADPQERNRKHLPPKSYADAAHEALGEIRQDGDTHAMSDASAHTATYNPVRNEDGEKRKQGHDHILNGTREESAEKISEILPRVTSNSVARTESKQQKPPAANMSKSRLKTGREAGRGWRESAIHWAPLNVPLQRRLQTMAVLWHSTAIALLLSLFFLVAAFPLSWPLLVPYLAFTLIFSDASTSGTLSRRSQFLRRSKLWSAFASYYPALLHRTVELEPSRKYIFGYHPHGIISHGAFAAFGTEALGFSDLFPGITNTLLTLDSNFRIPFYRDYLLALGLASVSKESIVNLLSKGGVNGQGMGRAVTIVVGGARESLDAQPHVLRLVLNSRKGFVKLAIRLGADLVPVLAFGENELYEQVDSEQHPYVHRFQMVLKKAMGFTVPLFHARGIFNYDVGLMPYRRRVDVVVGKPIYVKQQGSGDDANGKVDDAYLDEIHGKYVAELRNLWDTHKDTFAKDREGELEIIE